MYQHRVCSPVRQPDPSPIRPFAALPHDISGDPRLTPTDLAVLLALLYWCRSRAFCWPSDASIGGRIGRKEATVQRRLKALEGLGFIRREKTDRNRTGRVIFLRFRETSVREAPRSSVRDEGYRVVPKENQDSGKEPPRTTRPETPPRSEAPRPSVRPSGAEGEGPSAEGPEIASESVQPSEPQKVKSTGSVAGNASESVLGAFSTIPGGSDRPETENRGGSTPSKAFRTGGDSASKAPGVPRPLPVVRKGLPKLETTDLARLAENDPILARELARRTAPRPEAPPEPKTIPEMIARVRECPSHPPRLAHALTVEFHDPGSYSGFLNVCHRCFRGEIPPDLLGDAYRQARNPGVRNPGAVFHHALRRIRERLSAFSPGSRADTDPIRGVKRVDD